MTEPSGDYDKRLMRLATLLVRDQAAAEQVVRDVLASSPPQVRDGGGAGPLSRKMFSMLVRCRYQCLGAAVLPSADKPRFVRVNE